MRHVDTNHAPDDFDVVAETARSQGATLILAPGDRTGGPNNRHEDSDQWLYVVSGEGEATVEGRRIELAPGSLLLIERGERHEIRNGEAEPLVTVNVYAPPAY